MEPRPQKEHPHNVARHTPVVSKVGSGSLLLFVLGKTKVVGLRYQIEDDTQLESMLLRAEVIKHTELYCLEATACL